MTVETMIDRVDLVARKPPFPQWLGQWAQAQHDGWDITVLVDAGETNAIGLACRPCPTEHHQLSLLADGDAA